MNQQEFPDLVADGVIIHPRALELPAPDDAGVVDLASSGTEYASYVALLTTEDPPDPVVVLGTNGIGEIVWTKDSAGVFLGVLSDAFPVDKTWCPPPAFTSNNDPASEIAFTSLSRADANTVLLKTYDKTGAAFDTAKVLQIEIRVYPT